MQDLRTTSGTRISIGYDPAANMMIFREEGWHAEAFRNDGEPTIVRLQRPIGGAVIARLRDKRRRTRMAPTGR